MLLSKSFLGMWEKNRHILSRCCAILNSFLSLFLISPKGENIWIYEYFHSSIVNSLIIIGRKWQCKQPSSEKHMNTWISEWEPLWANVLLSGEVWVRAVYTVQSSCGELLFYGFCWKLSSETKSLSQGMPLNPSSFQPLFVSADFLKYNIENSSQRQKAINMIICIFHSPVYYVYVPQRSNSFKLVHRKYSSLSPLSDWRRTTLTSVYYLEMYWISGATVFLTVSVIVSVIGVHICLVSLAECCKKGKVEKEGEITMIYTVSWKLSETSKVSQGHASWLVPRWEDCCP